MVNALTCRRAVAVVEARKPARNVTHEKLCAAVDGSAVVGTFTILPVDIFRRQEWEIREII